MITHAYENVPYYGELFNRNGIHPDDIRSVSDLYKIPVTLKRDLQVLNADQIISRGTQAEKLIARTTSGSTGEPFTIRRSWREERLLGLYRLRAMRELGQRLTDKVASVGVVHQTHARDFQFHMQLFRALGLYRNVRIDSLLHTDEILERLFQLQPNIITGFPGVISVVAQKMLQQNSYTVRPKFVRVNGEVLTPLMRHQIGEAFHSRVFNFYASHEFRVIAWECLKTGELHTCDDGVIVEVLKNGRPALPGEKGELVGTALYSYAMPLIRFKLGDVVVKGSETCKCGAPFSTLREVYGRMVDYFPLADGKQIHPFEIVLVLFRQSLPWVRQYQLVQEREDRILMRLVATLNPTQEQIDQLQKAVSLLLPPQTKFEVTLVPEIRIEPNGKYRVSRSMVKSAYDLEEGHVAQSGALQS